MLAGREDWPFQAHRCSLGSETLGNVNQALDPEVDLLGLILQLVLCIFSKMLGGVQIFGQQLLAGFNGLCRALQSADPTLQIRDGAIGNFKALGPGGKLRLHISQESRCPPHFLLEGLHLFDAPAKLFDQPSHLLVNFSLGSGCDT